MKLWRVGKEATDKSLSALQSILKSKGMPDLDRIADFGLNGLSDRNQTQLMKALFEYSSADSSKPSHAASALMSEVAGLSKSIPDNLDGTSFKDHLLDQKAFPDRDIFFGYEPKLGTAMRDGDWKMIIKGKKVELYHLADDIGERRNLVDKHPDRARKMRDAITTWKSSTTWKRPSKP